MAWCASRRTSIGPLAKSRASRASMLGRSSAIMTRTGSSRWTRGAARSSGTAPRPPARPSARPHTARRAAACGRTTRACRHATPLAMSRAAAPATSACGRARAWRLATPSGLRSLAIPTRSACGRTKSARRVAGPSARTFAGRTTGALGPARSARTHAGRSSLRTSAASTCSACSTRASASRRAIASGTRTFALMSSDAPGPSPRVSFRHAAWTPARPAVRTAPGAAAAVRSGARAA
mmetsp:Transcript_72216/g.234569  ORF Transcript_72216/g.234569 Transcript_72216/m.234569 type:complete len:237 (+) Transcript_72216:419-1129(+)